MFTITRDKAYIQEGIFLENTNSIACGSDHGKIYLYTMETTKQLQVLKHGPKTSMIQVLDVSISSCQNQLLLTSMLGMFNFGMPSDSKW